MGDATKHLTRAPLLLVLNISRRSRFVKNDRAAFCRRKEGIPMNLSTVASTCSEITVILAALAMLIKPIRNKRRGWTS